MSDSGFSMRAGGTTYNLLFVCTGNTCRSPMAEAIARALIEERGWTHVAVRSAGTGAVEGAPASDVARDVAREHGLDLGAHLSAPLTPGLIDWADLILAMSPAHVQATRDLGADDKVCLVTEFIGDRAGGLPVSDPFGGTHAQYRDTYDQLHEAILAVLSRLEPILAP